MSLILAAVGSKADMIRIRPRPSILTQSGDADTLLGCKTEVKYICILSHPPRVHGLGDRNNILLQFPPQGNLGR